MSQLTIREQDLSRLLWLLQQHLPTVTAWAYGSRVNGRSHEASDLDLALRAPNLQRIDPKALSAFQEALTDSNIPILIDSRDWAALPANFQAEIERQYVALS